MKSVCPGCNFGCGLYIQPAEPCGVVREFRKGCEVNEGKLYKFGMRLNRYYFPPNTSRVDGKEVALDEAVEEASKRLSSLDAVEFVSFGGAPSEELLALIELARAKGKVPQMGLGVLSSLPKEAYPSVATGAAYADVESAKTLVLVGVDPHEQYPLILRRILKAKQNGAKVVFCGWRDPRGLADELVLLEPSKWQEQLANLKESLEGAEDAVVISDVHPLSEGAMLAHTLNLARAIGAKLLLLKPFANVSGMMLLMSPDELSAQKSPGQLISEIEEGNIKGLVVHEVDLLEALPQSERVRAALEKLELLVYVSSRKSPMCEIAHVVISPEQFWQKRGIVVNNEGRLLELGGEGTEGLTALSKLAVACGGSELSFDDAHASVLAASGTEQVDEYSVPSYERGEYPEVEVPAATNAERALVLAYTPFTWRDGEDAYVVLGRKMVSEAHLQRGGLAIVRNESGEGRYPFRLEHVADGVVLTFGKLPLAASSITPLTSVESARWYEAE